jgi:hypothetical protein
LSTPREQCCRKDTGILTRKARPMVASVPKTTPSSAGTGTDRVLCKCLSSSRHGTAQHGSLRGTVRHSRLSADHEINLLFVSTARLAHHGIHDEAQQGTARTGIDYFCTGRSSARHSSAQQGTSGHSAHVNHKPKQVHTTKSK